MCGGGGGGSDYVAPAPTVDNTEVEEAMRKERELARKRKGRKSTILTNLAQEENTTMLGS